MEDTKQTFIARMQETLCKSPCQQINLVCYAQTGNAELLIAGDRYAKMAPYIGQPFGVHVEMREMKTTEARYDALTDTLNVPRWDFGKTVQEEATLVHEATHAIIAGNAIRGIWIDYNEAFAYIAGGMYHARANGGKPEGDLRIEGLRLAKTMIATGTNRIEPLNLRKFAHKVAVTQPYGAEGCVPKPIEAPKRSARP